MSDRDLTFAQQEYDDLFNDYTKLKEQVQELSNSNERVNKLLNYILQESDDLFLRLDEMVDEVTSKCVLDGVEGTAPYKMGYNDCFKKALDIRKNQLNVRLDFIKSL